VAAVPTTIGVLAAVGQILGPALLAEALASQWARESTADRLADDFVFRPRRLALTRHDQQTWWRSYVSPHRDARARRGNVAKLTAHGLAVRPEVDQRLTGGSQGDGGAVAGK
jgi:hypothetical protein